MILLDIAIALPARAIYVVPIYVDGAHDRLAWGGQADRSLSPHAVSLELLVTLHEVDDPLDKTYELYNGWHDDGPPKEEIQQQYENTRTRMAKVELVDAEKAKEYCQQPSHHLALCGI